MFRENSTSLWPSMRALSGQFEIHFDDSSLPALKISLSQLNKISDDIYATIIGIPIEYLNKGMKVVIIHSLHYYFLDAPSVQVPVNKCNIEISVYSLVGNYVNNVTVIPLNSNILQEEFTITAYNTIMLS